MRLCEIKIVGTAQKTVQGRATLWGGGKHTVFA